jgi:hypothetical protein
MMTGDNLVTRLWALVVKPGLAMEWVRERPQWLLAGLILFVTISIYSAAIIHISAPEQMELMRDTRLGRLTPAEDWQQSYEESLDPTPVKRLIHGLSGGIGVWIILFIYGLLFLLFSKLAGGPGSFKQIMGVAYWAMIIPYVLGSLVKLPLIIAKQSVMGVSIGLAALAPEADLLSAKYQALMYFGDFFMWWGLVLMIIGYQKVNDFSRAKAAIVVVLPWLLVTGALYGLGRLFV